MASQEEDHRQARRYLEMAQNCADPKIAGLLRALAAEFFALANKPADSVSILEEQVEPSKQSKLEALNIECARWQWTSWFALRLGDYWGRRAPFASTGVLPGRRVAVTRDGEPRLRSQQRTGIAILWPRIRMTFAIGVRISLF